MFCTALVPTIEVFNIPAFLVITPMFLFSGTFFPLEQMPAPARALALCLPLTHLADLVRCAFLHRLTLSNLWSLLYLVVFTVIFFPSPYK